MEEIKEKLAKGQIDAAIEEMILLFTGMPVERELIILSSRFSSLLRKQRMAIIDEKEAALIENRIIYELLELLNDPGRSRATKAGFDSSPPPAKRLTFLEANPLPDRNLFSNIEIREIEIVVSRTKHRLELFSAFGLSLDRFIQSISHYRPQIIHVSAFSNQNGIFFHSKADQPVQVDNDTFQSVFKLIEQRPECIFFNTFIAESLATNISAEDIFVIGSKDIISSQGAIEFATGFYTAIAFNKDYQTAFDLGLRALSIGEYRQEQNKLFSYFRGAPYRGMEENLV